MKANPLKRAIMRACADAEFRQALLADPAKALADEGVEVPPNVTVKVHESQENKLILVLPGPHGEAFVQRKGQLPSGPVADVPAGLTLAWQGNTLVAAGKIEVATAPALRRELLKAFTDVDVDFAGVTFMGSAGISALLVAQKHLAEHDAELRLMNVVPQIKNILDVSGLSDLFEFGYRAGAGDPATQYAAYDPIYYGGWNSGLPYYHP